MAGTLSGLRYGVNSQGTLSGRLRPIPAWSLTTAQRFLRAVVASAALLTAASAGAAETPFSEGLSVQERLASGIPKLSHAQVASLDRLVGHDVTLARQGGVTGFSSEFSARRTVQERAASGIDQLSDAERERLNAVAARAIATPPPPSDTFTYQPPAAPPGMEEVRVSSPPKLEIHGDLSVFVGGGHGSSFYGTSEDLFVTDPSGTFTLGLGFSDFHGKGLLGPFGPYCPIPYVPSLAGW